MKIENNILKHYLSHTYFITGTAYAGKSTMVSLLAQRYGLTACTENYHMQVSRQVAQPQIQPNLCYFQTMSGWPEFLNRTPQEYEAWIRESSREAAEFEVAQLLALSQSGGVIVDTNIPLDLLHEISDYRHVAVMLAPQWMSVERFFDREDEEKQFLLRQIQRCEDPKATTENFRQCLMKINSPECYQEYAQSGFFTIVRDSTGRDTRQETLMALARHFGLEDGK